MWRSGRGPLFCLVGKTKMEQQEKWHRVIGPLLQGTPFELIGVECTGGVKHTLVRMFVDKPGGITIDEIAKLSRQFHVVLEVEQIVKGLYTLEVSSPGLEKPLFTPQHFQFQVGQVITLKTRYPCEGRSHFKGVLQRATQEGVELVVEGQLFSFVYEDIQKAKVVPEITIKRK